MISSKFLASSAVATLVTAALSAAVVPSASAAPCPDVEVIFARGTHEPPGTGAAGQAFIDALRPQIGERSLRSIRLSTLQPTNGPRALTASGMPPLGLS